MAPPLPFKQEHKINLLFLMFVKETLQSCRDVQERSGSTPNWIFANEEFEHVQEPLDTVMREESE